MPFKPIIVGDLVIFLGTCRLIFVFSIVKHTEVSKILGTSRLTEMLKGTMFRDGIIKLTVSDEECQLLALIKVLSYDRLLVLMRSGTDKKPLLILLLLPHSLFFFFFFCPTLHYCSIFSVYYKSQLAL